MALDENIKSFVLHISSLRLKINIYIARKAQMALLLAKKVTILDKYSNFANMFLEQSANVLQYRIKVNEHAIELEKGKQPLYRPIYNLRPLELKTFKTYIKINLVNDLIRAPKSPAGAPILFVHKLNISFHLCVNY